MKIGKLFNLNNRASDIESGIEVFGKTYELAKLVQDPKFSGLSSHLDKLTSTLEPLADSQGAELIIGFAEPILSSIKITTLLREYYKALNDPKTFVECVVLVCFQAYLESLQRYIQEIRIPKKIGRVPSLLRDISNHEVTEDSAKEALTSFPQSDLAEAFKKIVIAQLHFLELPIDETELLAERAIWHTDNNIPKFWNDLPESIRRYSNISISELGRKQSGLESYLRKIENTDAEQLSFQADKNCICLDELYVSLEIKEKEWGDSDKDLQDKQSVDIAEWVTSKVLDLEQKNSLVIIEGTSGQGKTAFCKIFVGRVKEKIYPAYIPIYIRLQDINSRFTDIKESLNKYLSTIRYFNENKEWLTDSNKRFLIMLDGFDELPLSNVDTLQFLEEILKFQEGTHNQFLLTSRTNFIEVFQDILRRHSVCRGIIQPMNDQIRLSWIKNWAKAVSVMSLNKEEKSNILFHFSAINKHFLATQTRAKENFLLLLLLKALHEIEIAIRGTPGNQAEAERFSNRNKKLIRVILKDLENTQIFREAEKEIVSFLERVNRNVTFNVFIECFLFLLVKDQSKKGVSLYEQFTFKANRENLCREVANAILLEEDETEVRTNTATLLKPFLSELQEPVEAINDYFKEHKLNRDCLIGNRSKSLIPFVFSKIEKERKFDDFLMSSCPEDIEIELAREPLVLYLLATLHDADLVNVERLLQSPEAEVRGLIYQKAIELSVRQINNKRSSVKLKRTYGFDNSCFEGLLEAFIEESALCATQVQGQLVSLENLKKRLELESSFVCRALTRCTEEDHDANREGIINELVSTFLTKFQIRLIRKGEMRFASFSHKSLREYLFARVVSRKCGHWSQVSTKGSYNIQSSKFEDELHDLLGYGILSSDILKYIAVLFAQKIDEGKINPEYLLERLQNFYSSWCQGKRFNSVRPWFISVRDSKAKAFDQDLQHIDLYAGLNVIVLLLELHQYARQRNLRNLLFYPCKSVSSGSLKSEENFLRAAGYCYCMRPEPQSRSISRNFVASIGHFLSGIQLVGANLRGLDLSEANFNEANLSDTDLSRANLSSCSFVRASLVGAKLVLADLTEIDVTDADLSNADLRGANLNGLDFTGAESFAGCNLSDVSVQNANLKGVDFSGSDLTGLKLCNFSLEGTDLTNANLSGCDLRNLDLSLMRLTGTNLTDAELDNSSFEGADLSRAILVGLDLRNFDLSNTKMVNADLSRAILCAQDLTDADSNRCQIYTSANLSGANLREIDLTEGSEESFNDTDFNEAILSSADLTDAELTSLQFKRVIAESANFTGADLRDTDFTDANLKGAVLIRSLLNGSDLIRTDLSHADLTGADLYDANLQGADVSHAILTSIRINKNTKWEGIIGLDTAIDSPL